MKHLFVPYELALLAKEKGFDEKCFAEYINNGVFTIHQQNLNDDDEPSIIPIEDEIVNGYTNTHPNYFLEYGPVSAPLYQQLVDWFRERDFSVEHSTYSNGTVEMKVYRISTLDQSFSKDGEYYEALTAALTEAFKLIP